MTISTAHNHLRRQFLVRAATLSMGGLLGTHSVSSDARPALDTTKVRFVRSPAICLAPQFLAEELLRGDGFTDVEYLPLGTRTVPNVIAEGKADISMWDAPGLMPALDKGRSLVVISGVQAGCYELVANERVHAIRDLKGKSVAVQWEEGGARVLLSSMLAYVGMDPRTDVKWVWGESMRDARDLFIEGKADAFLGFAPEPQELRMRGIGHVIVNTAQDRPWSQYFCCMVAANREYVERYPVATKRVLRAILLAADICSSTPGRAARYLSDHGYERRYAVGLEVLRDLPFDFWRKANPEDTIRFHALRLHEVGMINTPPNELIARGTDWRFLNELKRELKA
jgi:NitT/TauT family transport system substrate-binding protein